LSRAPVSSAVLTAVSALLVVAGSHAVIASPASIPAVSVESTGAVLTVRVSEPTLVRTVLDTVCERTEANCKLPAKMPDKVVEAGTVRGSWPEVVGALLEDSGLSFAVTPPVSGRAAYLVIELVDAAAAAAARSTSTPPGAASSEVSPPSPTLTPHVADELPAEEEDAAPPAEADQEASAAPADPAQATLVTAATAAAMPGVSFVMTPFADSKGNPLMSRIGGDATGGVAPGQAVLPYSDEIGNPIVVPITNEPLSLTPFAGPDGQPWPAPVPQPNQKLEFPIPPTAPQKDER